MITKIVLPGTFQHNAIPNSVQVVSSNPLFVFFKRKWVYHTLFWIVYYLFICLAFYASYGIPDLRFYLQISLFMPLSALLVYANIYMLIPFFLYNKKYLLYTFLLIVAIIATAYADQLVKEAYLHFGYQIFAYTAGFNIKSIFSEAVALFYLTGFTTGVKLSKDWIQNQQLMKEKEKLYLETELNFLKTQIHPHFFFNTLNNLYSLTLKKSDLAPEIVLKLSSLMSYMLYESNTAKVSLAKEINYLQNYLDLEKLRFGQRLSVQFEIEGRIDEVSIPPMILILFVENSFKHGVKNKLDQIRIEISLRVEDSFLYFQVTNPVAENRSKENTGIGLKNAVRRLNLLYGDRHKLDIIEQGQDFIVSLKIPV